MKIHIDHKKKHMCYILYVFTTTIYTIIHLNNNRNKNNIICTLILNINQLFVGYYENRFIISLILSQLGTLFFIIPYTIINLLKNINDNNNLFELIYFIVLLVYVLIVLFCLNWYYLNKFDHIYFNTCIIQTECNCIEKCLYIPFKCIKSSLHICNCNYNIYINNYIYKIPLKTTILEIKEIISKKYNIKIDNIQLYYNDILLNINKDKLKKYNISNYSKFVFKCTKSYDVITDIDTDDFCNICTNNYLENNLTKYKLHCSHDICGECYTKIKLCPLCKTII